VPQRRRQQQAGARIPNARGAICARRENSLAVWTELGGAHAVVAGGFAFLSFLVTRAYYSNTLTAKLHDRLLELNKLTVQYAEVAADFDSMRHRQTPYFSTPPADKNEAKQYQQLRAYTHFRLNLYEEAFMATQGVFSRHTERGQAWRKYIKERMTHRLAQELFEQTADQFNASFVKFARVKPHDRC
jgi:hypothetical protein